MASRRDDDDDDEDDEEENEEDDGGGADDDGTFLVTFRDFSLRAIGCGRSLSVCRWFKNNVKNSLPSMRSFFAIGWPLFSVNCQFI